MGRTHVSTKGQNLNFYSETLATTHNIYFIRLRILPRNLVHVACGWPFKVHPHIHTMKRKSNQISQPHEANIIRSWVSFQIRVRICPKSRHLYVRRTYVQSLKFSILRNGLNLNYYITNLHKKPTLYNFRLRKVCVNSVCHLRAPECWGKRYCNLFWTTLTVWRLY